MPGEARERAREIARAGDYWKDYPSIRCHLETKSGKRCNQRLRASEIDIELLTERIAEALSERPSTYVEGYRAGLVAAAQWHDERRRATPDAFEMELHQASVIAIRALPIPTEEASETIERAAIKYDDIVVDVPRPGRHHHCFRLAEAFGKNPNDFIEQGFTTSRGRFVDRREACLIAARNNQIVKKTGPDDVLFSEDVWPHSLPSQLHGYPKP